MAIKSIVEMKAKPGRRDELLSTLQQMSAVDAPGFIAAEHYRNVEDEDTVIGIYDWKSNEERVAWSQSLDPGTREQLLERDWRLRQGLAPISRIRAGGLHRARPCRALTARKRAHLSNEQPGQWT